MTRHGENRKQYEVTESAPVHFRTIDDNQPITVFNSHSYTVAERWCEVCNEWVDAKGIMGALLCPQCNASWDKTLWYSPTQHQPEGGWWEGEDA